MHGFGPSGDLAWFAVVKRAINGSHRMADQGVGDKPVLDWHGIRKCVVDQCKGFQE